MGRVSPEPLCAARRGWLGGVRIDEFFVTLHDPPTLCGAGQLVVVEERNVQRTNVLMANSHHKLAIGLQRELSRRQMLRLLIVALFVPALGGLYAQSARSRAALAPISGGIVAMLAVRFGFTNE